MPPSSFLMVSLNHVNELGLYRLKCTIPLMRFHSFACKGRRIPTSSPLTQHVKACEVLRVWPLLLHMQPIHIWNARNKTAQITCSQSHDTDKRRTCCSGSLLPGSRSNTAHTRAHRSQGKKIMRLFSNQQIAFMLWVSGEACEALIRSFALRCFPVAPRMPLSANWIGWPFSPHNQIDCISPKRLFPFNYHKFVILHPPVMCTNTYTQGRGVGQWRRDTPFVWNAVDHYTVSCPLYPGPPCSGIIPRKTLLWQMKHHKTLDGLGRAWKVSTYVCARACVVVKVVSAEDNNTESSVRKTRSSGQFHSPHKSM